MKNTDINTYDSMFCNANSYIVRRTTIRLCFMTNLSLCLAILRRVTTGDYELILGCYEVTLEGLMTLESCVFIA